MIATYEVQTADGVPLVSLTTDRPVKAQHNRALGVAWVYEVDKIGRRLHAGQEARVGYDPLAEPGLVLVTIRESGKRTTKRVPIVGEAHPSTVLMPEPEDASSGEQ